MRTWGRTAASKHIRPAGLGIKLCFRKTKQVSHRIWYGAFLLLERNDGNGRV